VVLSACETGLGEASPGEGVQGLRRALIVAGSETQVISLWRIDDQATVSLLSAYYDRLLAGAGRSEAMREAQLGLLRQGATAHPFYWASFIVSGDGTPLSRRNPTPARTPPGPRGCACAAAGEASDPSGAVAALAAALACLLRGSQSRMRRSRFAPLA
jgi:MYXO-CTERM domain-containing protein